MSTTGSTHRPGTVTTVVVLTILSGVLDIIAGATTWALAGNKELQDVTDLTSGTITAVAIFYIIIGLATIAVGLGLRSGSNGARTLVAVLMVIRIIGAVGVLIALGSQNLAEVLAQIITAVLVLAFLYNRKANEFFA